MNVSQHQAAAFLETIVGYELCTGAGEDESAQYQISPVPRAFLAGAIGWENVPNCMISYGTVHNAEQLRPLAEFIIACGEALLGDAKSQEAVDTADIAPNGYADIEPVRQGWFRHDGQAYHVFDFKSHPGLEFRDRFGNNVHKLPYSVLPQFRGRYWFQIYDDALQDVTIHWWNQVVTSSSQVHHLVGKAVKPKFATHPANGSIGVIREVIPDDTCVIEILHRQPGAAFFLGQRVTEPLSEWVTA